MEPKLGWVWLSQSERMAAEASLAVAGPEGTRDELGFGVIHFAYADRFFPGTSVQHTSLRYVWFVCWALQEMETRSPGGLFPETMFEEIEDRTGRRLLERYGTSDGTGIVGGRVLRKGGSPVSKPSGIYWSALRTWGLLSPLPSTGTPPYRSDLTRQWDTYTRRDRPEVDAFDRGHAFFADPAPMPSDWTRKRGGIGFELDTSGREGERIRAGWSRMRDSGGQPTLLSRLAERRRPAPKALNSCAVREICSPAERLALERADCAASLVCIARALYVAMVGDLKRGDGATVENPDRMLADALNAHAGKALLLDLGLLEGDVPALGELRPLLTVVQNWIAGEQRDYGRLQPAFLRREHALKDDRAMLLKGSSRRREAWDPSTPWPLTYRWEKVAAFLEELAPAA